MRVKRSSILLGAAVALLAGLAASSANTVLAAPRPGDAQREFVFTYQAHVPANPSATDVHLWIPLPQADGYQDIRDLKIVSPVSYTEGNDPEYRNRFAMFTPTAAQSAAGYDVTMSFTVTRHEHYVDVHQPKVVDASAKVSSSDALMQRYLQPDKLVPLNGTIAELAKEHTTPDMTPIQKAHSVYEYVVATMKYDKTGEGWGRGDAIWACTSKRGNCTDFHSLFIGMMRAEGIPARFEIGFPIPEGKTQGDIAGYHCWAEFFLNGAGWIPVDASEAWKNPARHDYFFGSHDVNRVFFTYGRDIRLSPEQKADPLNYFIYPYAEANGQPVKGLETHFSFRDVATSPTTASSGN